MADLPMASIGASANHLCTIISLSVKEQRVLLPEEISDGAEQAP